MSEPVVFRGVYRNPQTNILTVKTFYADITSSVSNTDIDYVLNVIKKLAEEFGIVWNLCTARDKYYHREVDNPIVAYINIEYIIGLTENGDEIDMSCLDDVAEEFAYNEDYEEFISNRILAMENKELAKRLADYIINRALEIIKYRQEKVTEYWEAWKKKESN